MIFVGQASLRHAVNEYLEHYHRERNHQGLENRLLKPSPTAKSCTGTIDCQTRLGGVLSYLSFPKIHRVVGWHVREISKLRRQSFVVVM